MNSRIGFLSISKPREAAFQALLLAMRDEGFISDYLQQWKQESNPSLQDFQLAQQIAYGACRMRFSLDESARQLSGRSSLQLKKREKALLYTALVQCFYMNRIPLYAVVNETVAIAKRHCGASFAGFLNALLRNIERKSVTLPIGDDVESLSIRYSFPKLLVEKFLKEFGIDITKKIMEASNAPGITMARFRGEDSPLPLVEGSPCVVVQGEEMDAVVRSKDYYIQNATPAALMKHLSEGVQNPLRILDLCAAPGGKLIAAHDLFPDAELFANDVTESKIIRLSENLKKYGISATVNCSPGELYKSNFRFDIVIVDAPCSNSGVLNKRPEARWRITQEALTEQENKQKELLMHAKTLLSPDGEIWYMTCSILQEENQTLVNSVLDKLGMRIRTQKAFLPNVEGWDGGYGCVLFHTETRSVYPR